MFGPHPLRFPDVKAWAVDTYLPAQLAARPAGETYADGVTVAGQWTDTALPNRLVTVRDDGGTRDGPVLKRSLLAVNVWAESWTVASDLSRLVVALLESSPGSGDVVSHEATYGPIEIVEAAEKPHFYFTVELKVRGSSL